MSLHPTTEETMRRENAEEVRYDLARAAGLIVAATVDEFKSRAETQIGSMQSAIAEYRDQIGGLRYAIARGEEREQAMATNVGGYQTALNDANATIAALSKKLRIKAVLIPYPVHVRAERRDSETAKAPDR